MGLCSSYFLVDIVCSYYFLVGIGCSSYFLVGIVCFSFLGMHATLQSYIHWLTHQSLMSVCHTHTHTHTHTQQLGTAHFYASFSFTSAVCRGILLDTLFSSFLAFYLTTLAVANIIYIYIYIVYYVNEKFQWHHWESNPRPSGLKRSVSTNCATAYPQPPSSAEVKRRIELYLCHPWGPSWPVPGWPDRYQ
jgi:hypothetical protein